MLHCIKAGRINMWQANKKLRGPPYNKFQFSLQKRCFEDNLIRMGGLTIWMSCMYNALFTIVRIMLNLQLPSLFFGFRACSLSKMHFLNKLGSLSSAIHLSIYLSILSIIIRFQRFSSIPAAGLSILCYPSIHLSIYLSYL